MLRICVRRGAAGDGMARGSHWLVCAALTAPPLSPQALQLRWGDCGPFSERFVRGQHLFELEIDRSVCGKAPGRGGGQCLFLSSSRTVSIQWVWYRTDERNYFSGRNSAAVIWIPRWDQEYVCGRKSKNLPRCAWTMIRNIQYNASGFSIRR